MSSGLTGLFLGAGASYEVGLPLVWELTTELKNWLTPDKFRDLNAGWRAQGNGHSDEVIEDVAQILAMSNLHYESILGYLETQYRRHSQFQQEYHDLYSWLVEVIYHFLCIRHTNNVSYIQRHVCYYEGIAHLAALNNPLWIFSLNHDVITEALATHYKIPLNCGFTEERVTLPRRDKNGSKIGDLKAEIITGEQLEKGVMPFFHGGTTGINLLKIHGALDVFTFRDGKDLLRLLPLDDSVSGVINALRAVNEELIYIHSAAPGRPVKVTNEIAYADDEGEMQFLRRTLLAGAYKFDSRRSQVLPPRLLDHFKKNINYVSTLVCLGYGFGDIHINQIIRGWLEFSAERNLEIVGPGTKAIPPFLLHLAPQITLKDASATDFLDATAGIVRCKRDRVEKRLSVYIRNHGIKAQTELHEFIGQHMEHLTNRLVEKVKSLPIHHGDIDLSSVGTTPEELARSWMTEVGGNNDDVLEAFLNSKGA